MKKKTKNKKIIFGTIVILLSLGLYALCKSNSSVSSSSSTTEKGVYDEL